MAVQARYHTPVETGISQAVAGIDYAHAAIHGGKAFTSFQRKTGDTNASASMILRTPASGHAHTVFRFSVNVAAEFYVYESSTLSASGTALTPLKRNRSGTVSVTVETRSTATVSANGTQLVGKSIGTASAFDRGLEREEYILKQSTVHVIRVIFRAAGGIAYIGAEWNEES